MKHFLISILAALLMTFPLLAQAQTQGQLSVRLDNPDIPVFVGENGGAGSLDIATETGGVKLRIGGERYPLLEVNVPVAEGQTTEVRGNVAESTRFPMMLTVEDFKERVAPELFYNKDELLEEHTIEHVPPVAAFIYTTLVGLAMPIVFPMLMLADPEDESTVDNSDSDDAAVKVGFYIGCAVGVVCLFYGLVQLIRGEGYDRKIPIQDNINHNKQILDMANEQADTINFQMVFEENGRRLEKRNAAIAETFIQYRVGDGPWIDATPDLSEYTCEIEAVE